VIGLVSFDVKKKRYISRTQKAVVEQPAAANFKDNRNE